MSHKPDSTLLEKGQQMEKEKKGRTAHCLVLPFPAQGHINPLLQFSKRLEHRGVKVTLVTTRFMCNTLFTSKELTSNIALESISDGYDEGGMGSAESVDDYVKSFWRLGPRTLAELVQKLANSDCPVDCVVYDSTLPWGLDVAKKFGLLGAVFFTQCCAVDNIFFHAYHNLLKTPVSEEEILLPAMPQLAPSDLPSFMYDFGSYPVHYDVLLKQFSNIDKADWVLVNTFYELEPEVVDWIMKKWPLRTIGPTIPSMFLDRKLQDDKDYGMNIFKPNNDNCLKWLDDRAKGSVVYVSFGSVATLSEEQMEELAWGLRDSGRYFLWVVRASEEAKLPKDFVGTSEKGLFVTWCPQLQVLSHESVGCFVTHCGWNSTMEAVSLGIPMIALPQWADQPPNAKYIMDVWRMGIRAPLDEKGIVRRETFKACLKEILEGETARDIRKNAIKWSSLARNAAAERGSTDRNIAEFVAKLVPS